MTRNSSWFSLSLATWQMGLEAQQVIGLRLAKIAMGGEAAATETALMFSEKTEAAFAIQSEMTRSLLSGAGHLAPARAISHYRKKIRANRRRLTA